MSGVVWSQRARRALLSLAVACAVASFAPPLRAQTPEASIIGRVTDDSGAVLPGVTVTASSPALLGGQRVEVTSSSGEYRITPLPIGTYTVEYTLPGFQTRRQEGVRLTAGFTARLDVALQVGAVSESITVSGQSPLVDVQSTATNTVITQEILDSVPTGRNSLASLLVLAPGARSNPDEGKISGTNPAFRAFGRSNNAWVNVDGITTSAPWYNGSTGFSNNFNYQSFEEASVVTLGGSAEAASAGIQMNVISKSGGNDFHGKVLASQFFRGLQGRNIDDDLRRVGITETAETLKRWDRGGDIGGRVIRDKVWFYGAARFRTDREELLGAFLPDGSAQADKMDETMYVGKVTTQLNPSQKFIGAFHYRLRHDEGAPGADAAPESLSIHDITTVIGKGEWQLARGNKFLSVVGGSWASVSPPWEALTDIPDSSDEVTGFKWGVEDKAATETHIVRYDSKATLNWYKPDLFHGSHDFKFGGQFNIARGDFNTVDRGAAGNYRLIYRDLAPFQVQVKNAPVTPHTRLDYLGTYAQDSWRASRRLTLNLGVRVVNDHGWLPRQCREVAPAPFETLFPAECYEETHLKTLRTVQPRLHAAYDLTGDARTVIKGGWGRFYYMRDQAQMNLANPNADMLTVYRWRDLNSNQRFDRGEANLALDGPDFVRRTLAINQNLAGLVNNPDLKNAGSDEFSVSLERQVTGTAAVRVTGVMSKDFNTARVANTLRPYESYSIPVTNPDPGPDGRLGTADDTGRTITYYEYPASLAAQSFQRLMFINHPPSNRSYKSFEIAAFRRLSGRWQATASFSATKFDIPFIDERIGSGGSGNQRGVFSTSFNPNAEIFAKQDTWEWNSLVSGSYQFPLDVQFSAHYETRSGEPWARTVPFRGGRTIPSIELRVEEIGAHSTDVLHMLTLNLEKLFVVRSGQRLGLGVQIYNTLNVNSISCGGITPCVPAVRVRSAANFGVPTGIQQPRKAEVQLTYQF